MDRILLAAGLVLLCLWAGCAGSDAPPNGVLATYEKSGGFAGMDTRVVVRDDGTVTYEDRRAKTTKQANASPAAMDHLRAALRDPGLAAAKRSYTQPEGADLQQFQIHAQTPSGPKDITTFDAAEHPEAVTKLIEALDAIWGEARTAN